MSEPAAMKERLYPLLPAVYRLRDAAQGQPLRAFLAVAQAEAERLQTDIAGLYDNWFIETCEDWVVPYIADLLGVRRLPAVGGPGFNQRAHVARTLAYRRRKGTYALLADLARDVTGWPVRVVEMFRLVAATQHLDFLREANRTLDVRDRSALAKLDTAFDPLARTADVRRIAEGDVVRHNLPNIAVFAMRLASYRIDDAPAATVDAATGRYRFDQLGRDLPLWNPLRDQGKSGEEADLPLPLRPQALRDDLAMLRRAITITFTRRGGTTTEEVTVAPEEILITDLPDLPDRSEGVVVDPRLGRIFFRGGVAPESVTLEYLVGFSLFAETQDLDALRPDNHTAGVHDAIDPGPHGADVRLLDEGVPVTLPAAARVEGVAATRLLPSLWFAERLARDAGAAPGPGGELPVRAIAVTYTVRDENGALITVRVPPGALTFGDLSRVIVAPPDWLIPDIDPKRYLVAVDVRRGRLAFRPDLVPGVVPGSVRVSYFHGASGEVGAGPYDFADRTPPAGGLVELDDNDIHPLADLLDDISALAGRADITAVEVRATPRHRPIVALPATGATITLRDKPLVLDGLLFAGGPLAIDVQAPAGTRASLTLRRCTLVPGEVPLGFTGADDPAPDPSTDPAIDLVLDRCITADVGDATRRPDAAAVRDSIVDGAITTRTLTVERSTLRGAVRADTLARASDAIFLDAVSVRFAQRGCVRYSHVPFGSVTAQRFRCQPDLATADANLDERARGEIRRRVTPTFTSLRFGDPGYGQLARASDEQIRRGASDGGEMGAHQSLHNTQREDNLRQSLDEYLRFGQEAGVFFLT